MTLFLIAHKVSGEPAFDIATRIDCPLCSGYGANDDGSICHECDSTGQWWIIPTSGHRAYPWWFSALAYIWEHSNAETIESIRSYMPADILDHYSTRSEPSRLQALLALIPKKPEPKFPRRF